MRRGLGERDQKIELTLAGRIDLLKDYIRQHAAGKSDLEKHESSVERKLSAIDQRLAVLAGTVAMLHERTQR